MPFSPLVPHLDCRQPLVGLEHDPGCLQGLVNVHQPGEGPGRLEGHHLLPHAIEGRLQHQPRHTAPTPSLKVEVCNLKHENVVECMMMLNKLSYYFIEMVEATLYGFN